MTLVNHYGKPDLFITMTCNPKWREITENLQPYENAIDRPDLIAKVFNQKVKELKNSLIKKGHVGKCIAYTYVIEFQKRGLPHMHMLLFLDKNDKLDMPEKVDELISAEIPNENIYPKLYNVVKQFMIHGPCGEQNLNSPCMDKDTKKCTKNFPKHFIQETNFKSNGYPQYKRKNNGITINYKNKFSNRVADNRFVVPYNPYLLLKFNAHINVEVCSTVQCIKYLFKYCYKGYDCAYIKIQDLNMSLQENNETLLGNENDHDDEYHHDELKQYINTRYVCPPEAMYRLLEYPIHEISHTIKRLVVHDENQQNVYFEEGKEEMITTKNVGTTLTAYFELNQTDLEARKYLYSEIPRYYIFNDKSKQWSKRKRIKKPILSRMYLVNPKERERYFIRLLLLNSRGVKSFEELRTIDNILYDTFYEAAKAKNLIQEDEEWDRCLEEASQVQFPYALCELFAFICVFHNPVNSRDLYEKYKSNFYHPKYEKIVGENIALNIIEKNLNINGYSLSDFNLPVITEDVEHYINDTLTTEKKNVEDDLHLNIISLKYKQKQIFDIVLKNLEINSTNKYVFIDGPGGSGKSYLLNVLIDYLQFHNINHICVAWTGIAANLLKNGRTVHTTFKLPLNITDSTTCNIKSNSIESKKLKNSKIIIWDEISMTSKFAFEAVDRLMQDLCDLKKPFGGKTVIISGDFRQILPVVRHGSRTDIIENSVKNSYLWQNFIRMTLTENIRVSDNDNDFKQWLLDIGEGKRTTAYEENNDVVEIPDHIMAKEKNIIKEIFGTEIKTNETDLNEMVILAPTNNDVIHINNDILDILEGDCHEYLSMDTAEDDNGENLDIMLPIEFLNSLTPNGLPPHKLNLKIGAAIILLRNLNLNEGLCNGTRLIVKKLLKYSIQAQITSGKNVGKIVFIPRINLSPAKEEVPFNMRRRQFPIRLGFAMTINKAQGQSYDKVGVYLPSNVFSHGQLYVALSRARRKENLKILLVNNAIIKDGNSKKNYTKNIVFKEVL